MTDQGTESRRSSHRCPNRSHTVFEGWWPDGVVERCAFGQEADHSDNPPHHLPHGGRTVRQGQAQYGLDGSQGAERYEHLIFGSLTVMR